MSGIFCLNLNFCKYIVFSLFIEDFIGNEFIPGTIYLSIWFLVSFSSILLKNCGSALMSPFMVGSCKVCFFFFLLVLIGSRSRQRRAVSRHFDAHLIIIGPHSNRWQINQIFSKNVGKNQILMSNVRLDKVNDIENSLKIF